MEQFEPQLDERGGREKVAFIMGAHMNAIITHPLIDEVVRAAIDSGAEGQIVVNQWIASMKILNDPLLAEEDAKELDATTAQKLCSVVKEKSFSQLAAGTIESLPWLVPIYESDDLHEQLAQKMSELLQNGVLDSLHWISCMSAAGMTYDEIREHSALPIATSLISPAHALLMGRLMIFAQQGRPEQPPRTRPEALRKIKNAPPALIKKAYRDAKEPDDSRPLDSRGFCPAYKERNDNGKTWLGELLSRAICVHEVTSSQA